MRKTPTTLILGAGSSCAFGFPTGEGLRRLIISYRDREDVCVHIGGGQRSVNHFVDAFAESQLSSIDAFLGRSVADPEVGKRLIAFALLDRESEARLFDDVNDHWYRYMHNEIVNPVSKWEDLDFSWLSIVTFNYERSLEHFLFRALSRTYLRKAEEVWAKLKQLQIVHVYGRLGNLDRGDERAWAPFGVIQPEHLELFVDRAAKGIQVVPEGRVDSPSFQEAQSLIRKAKAIYFLGFGFDKVNVERLGAPDVFLVDGRIPKPIYSTVYGLTNAEVLLACDRVVGASMGTAMKKNAFDGNCLALLRQTLPFTEQ
jgi:hypothetical protein